MDPEGERGCEQLCDDSAMIPWLGISGPFSDHAQFEQCLQFAPVIGGFQSRWTDVEDPVMSCQLSVSSGSMHWR